MRLTPLFLTASVLAFVVVPAFAAAHTTHYPCTAPSKSVPPASPVVHVDYWHPADTDCIGVAVSSSDLHCGSGVHLDDIILSGLHVFALNGSNCQTGVVQEFTP